MGRLEKREEDTGMGDTPPRAKLLARCAVCRGDILESEEHEIWEGGFYCRRHSLPHLRERAREYAALLRHAPEIPGATRPSFGGRA